MFFTSLIQLTNLEKIADGKKRKNNYLKNNFLTTTKILVRIFFTLIGINL